MKSFEHLRASDNPCRMLARKTHPTDHPRVVGCPLASAVIPRRYEQPTESDGLSVGSKQPTRGPLEGSRSRMLLSGALRRVSFVGAWESRRRTLPTGQLAGLQTALLHGRSRRAPVVLDDGLASTPIALAATCARLPPHVVSLGRRDSTIDLIGGQGGCWRAGRSDVPGHALHRRTSGPEGHNRERVAVVPGDARQCIAEEHPYEHPGETSELPHGGTSRARSRTKNAETLPRRASAFAIGPLVLAASDDDPAGSRDGKRVRNPFADRANAPENVGDHNRALDLGDDSLGPHQLGSTCVRALAPPVLSTEVAPCRRE